MYLRLRVRMGYRHWSENLFIIKFSVNYWIAVVQFVFVLCYFMACKLATFNVAGLNNTSKRKKVFNYLKQKQFHLFFLQETHSISGIEKSWGYYSGNCKANVQNSQ